MVGGCSIATGASGEGAEASGVGASVLAAAGGALRETPELVVVRDDRPADVEHSILVLLVVLPRRQTSK